MRLLEQDVYVGVMRSTENTPTPLTVVSAEPFSGTAFASYRWYRTTVRCRYEGEITETDNTGPHEVPAQPGLDRED